MPTLTYPALKGFLARILHAAGAPPDDAEVVAEHLARSDLAGHPSHGTVRVPQYVQMVREGAIVPGGPFRVARRAGTAAACTGGWNFGQVAAARALELALEMARDAGTAAVTLRESSHVGRLGAYAERAAADGMMSLIACNNHGANPVMAPHGGEAGRLSPEALAVGAPGPSFPLVQDMALTVIPEGKVRVARAEGREVPPECILDNRGQPSTNPHDFYGPPRGALLPLGGPMGYKGFGLGVMVDILAGALSGGGCTLPGRTRTGNAVFIFVVRPEAFVEPGFVSSEVEALAGWIKSCPLRPGAPEVLLPGESEARRTALGLAEGLTVGEGTWGLILRTARELGVTPERA